MHRHTILSLAIITGCTGLLAFAGKSDSGLLTPKLNIDNTPPTRSGSLGGYAEVVSQVSPSVVSIFTTREETRNLSQVNPEQMPDLFNSPMFREFFGDRGRQRPTPRNRAPRRAPGQRGLGSGVILSTDGFILTNNHVVEGATDIQVKLDDGNEFPAEIVAADPASDLAVIRVEANDLPAATIGDSENLRPGDTVLAIGSPFGLNHTVTSGIVSATGRDNLNIVGYENFIQTDASINPGNSGGALVDNRGRVIGINTAIFSRSGGNVGIGFAIPVNMAIEIADELIQTGEIERGYLGVSLAPLTRTLAKALDIEGNGVLVNDVMTGTPAHDAGFRAGDVITMVQTSQVEDVADVRRLVGVSNPGEEVSFTVRRKRDTIELTATIARMPDNLVASASENDSVPGPIEKGALQGVQLGTLNQPTKDRLGLGEEVRQGVVVLDVRPDSRAAEAGLREGDVITEVNQETVSSPREAMERAGKTDDDVTLLRVTDGKRNRFLAIG